LELFKEIEEKFIETNEITLHTIIIGSGRPLILLHGFPDFWYGWKNIILGLKADYQLIIPDLRGYNLSEKLEGVENYKLNILVNDIKGLIEALRLSNVILIGHDWGGVVAWGFAEKYPRMLHKLIILNAPHYKIFQNKLMTDKAQQKASSYIFAFQKKGAENILSEKDYRVLKIAVFKSAFRKDAFTEFDKNKYIDAWSQPKALLCGINYYRANLDFKEWTGIIDVPTLVIWGLKDTALLPQVLDGLSDFVKNLKIIYSEMSSHWILHDDPQLVIKSIKEFI